jgi:hypothetical protein
MANGDHSPGSRIRCKMCAAGCILHESKSGARFFARAKRASPRFCALGPNCRYGNGSKRASEGPTIEPNESALAAHISFVSPGDEA